MSRSPHFLLHRRAHAHRPWILAATLLAALAVCDCPSNLEGAASKETIEKYPGGGIHFSYHVKDGEKEGPFTEFYENGKPKIKAAYKNNLLVGAHIIYFESGEPHVTSLYRQGILHGKTTELDRAGKTVRVAVYDDGKLHGVETLYRDGAAYWQINWSHGQAIAINSAPVYARPFDNVWNALDSIYTGAAVPTTAKPTILPRKSPVPVRPPAGRDPLHPTTTSSTANHPAATPPGSADPILERDRTAALCRLNVYRYLCELPEVALDADEDTAAQAAAKLLAATGKISREPTNPGMPEDEYLLARKGISKGAIDSGRGSIAASVEHFFDSSTRDQRASLEDRRWCLNPAMRTTGFGRSGDVTVMWSMDDRRRALGDWQTIAWPARGYAPASDFTAEEAWCVIVNPLKLTAPQDDFSVSIRPLDDQLHPGQPLAIADKHVAGKVAGLPDALVFRPAKIEIAPDRRYWVEITGVTNTAGKPSPIRYLVDFRDMRPGASMIAEVEGQPMFPRSIEQIRRGLEAINAAVPVEPRDLPPALGKDEKNPTLPATVPAEDAQALAAVRRLNSYRLICGVPADVALDAEETYYAAAGSKLLAAIGKLDHTPANPGLPDAEYQDGSTGTSHSNIYQGRGTLASSIDGYMNDSDASNIARIGHRRWCLNPAMQTTGFGVSGDFSAMWSFDQRRPKPPEWQMIAYPARGYMPLEYFAADAAWCVVLNPKALTPPSDKLDVTVKPLDEQFTPGEALEIGDQNIETKNYGGGVALIFRPKNAKIADGSRYRVEIKGVTTKAGDTVAIRYVVEFVDLVRASRSGR
jgi:uncharacterized protein YkwD